MVRQLGDMRLLPCVGGPRPWLIEPRQVRDAGALRIARSRVDRNRRKGRRDDDVLSGAGPRSGRTARGTTLFLVSYSTTLLVSHPSPAHVPISTSCPARRSCQRGGRRRPRRRGQSRASRRGAPPSTAPTHHTPEGAVEQAGVREAVTRQVERHQLWWERDASSVREFLVRFKTCRWVAGRWKTPRASSR